MEKKELFNKKEIKGILISGLILGFIFSFREWGYGDINLSIGLTNLVRATLLSLVALLIYQTSHKLLAKKYSAQSTFNIWNIKRFWFGKSSKFASVKIFGKSLKIFEKAGIFLPILLAFLSNGIVKFATVGSSEVKEISQRRLCKKFKHLTEAELAKIHLVGPLTILLLALIFHQTTGFEKFVEICYTISIFAMLPFSGLDGGKIFFSSLTLYIFGIATIIASIIFINLVSIVWTILLALVIATSLAFFFFYRNF